MLTLEYSKKRVQAFLEEIKRLEDSDFPHKHSKSVLEDIAKIFESRLAALQTLKPANSKDAVYAQCSDSLTKILMFLPLLGFILRSTNVRNSFEIYGPLLQLSKAILGPGTKLVISSEWNFSPFVFKPISDLPGVVLIGLPAFESNNPLLAPLAGHELGHSVWSQQKLGGKFDKRLQDLILDEFIAKWPVFESIFGPHDVKQAKSNLVVLSRALIAQAYAASRAEETFCDALGLRLFGEAFLHAFAYLLAPGFQSSRPLAYPSRKSRAANLEVAAKSFGVAMPANYADLFAADMLSPTLSKAEGFLSSVADSATDSLVPELIKEAETVTSGKVPTRDPAKIDSILGAYKLVVPAADSQSLTNILNAGWKSYMDQTFWQESPNLQRNKEIILRELVLKNIELLEIEQIMAAP